MIPKVIHCVWLSGEEKPQMIQDCIASWKSTMPDFDVKEWGMKDVRSIDSLFLQDAINAKKWAFATDFLRAYILYHYGGIYMDMDVYVYRSLEPFLVHNAFSGIEFWPGLYSSTINKKTVKGIGIDAAIMGAVKGHKWIGDILSYYDGKRFIPSPKEYMKMVMPNIIAQISLDYGFTSIPIFQILKNEVYLYPPDVFSAVYKNPILLIDSTEKAYKRYGEYDNIRYSCHLCANSWGYQVKQTKLQEIIFVIKKVIIFIVGKNRIARLKSNKKSKW
ncbi:glycosyltransferase [Barnesiella sp. An55]|uniref:glycosyltransferase family 32 protein n=1 Tax=Barnesiella sp. An55 TaxID=1965646 RepID=UPI000B3A08DF|nr:glycosyltransferase [Barnesiella sp. An55]OUN71492.1 hypothetical protein B5G10_08770 [Barnesiella sp. An55]